MSRAAGTLNRVFSVVCRCRNIIATVQNNEEDEDESDKEYESQPIISLKTALASADSLMRFVYDPPSGFVFDKKALSVLRSLFRAIKRVDYVNHKLIILSMLFWHIIKLHDIHSTGLIYYM